MTVEEPLAFATSLPRKLRMKLSARCCGRLQSSGGVSPTTWRNVLVVRRTDGPVCTQPWTPGADGVLAAPLKANFCSHNGSEVYPPLTRSAEGYFPDCL